MNANNLRFRLQVFARRLAAERWYTGYRYDDSVQSQVDEGVERAKAGTKQEIGKALLDILLDDDVPFDPPI